MRVTAKIEGVEREVAKLAKRAAAVRKVVRRAVEKGSTVQLQGVKAAATATKTGLHKKSLGKVVKTYTNGITVAYTGARKGFRVVVESINRGERRTTITARKLGRVGEGEKAATITLKPGAKVGKILNPVKYSHLIAKGHAKGKGKGAAKGDDFMNKAGRATQSKTYQTVRDEIAQKLMGVNVE